VVRRVRVAAMIMIAVGFIAGCAGSGGARPAAALHAAAGSGPLQFTAKTVSGEAELSWQASSAVVLGAVVPDLSG
jgi:hypothetical protein